MMKKLKFKRGVNIMGWLNFGSLILGLVAWILPIINIILYKNYNNKNWFIFSTTSITFCAISLWFQILYNNYLVQIEDWSALMDTTRAISIVSAILLIVTVILNIITLFMYAKKQKV